MKKLLLTFLTMGALLLDAQNPTIVRPTNGVRNATTATSGVVYPGLYTNGIGTGKVYSSVDGTSTNFAWIASSSGIPTNWTWTSGLLTNTTSTGSFNLATPAGQTNTASLFVGNWAGAITFGDATAVQFFRESTGFGYSIRQSADPDVGFNVGTSLGLRGSASTGGTINSTDTFVIYAEDASAGNINHILPTVNSGPNKFFKFYKNDSTVNTVSIATTGGTLMSNGQTNIVLSSKGESVTIWCNPGSSTWDIMDLTTYPYFWESDILSGTVLAGNAFSRNVDTTFWYNTFIYQSPPANADSVRYGYANLAQGTNFIMRVVGSKDSNAGITDWYVGTNKIGSIDWYNVVAAKNQVVEIPFTNTFPGRYEIKYIVNSKNGSSSDFYVETIKCRISK